MLFGVAMLSVSLGIPMFVMPEATQLSAKALVILGLWHSLMIVPLIRAVISIVVMIEFHGHRIIQWCNHPVVLIGIGMLLSTLDPYHCIDRVSHAYQLYSDVCFSLTRFVMLASSLPIQHV